MNNNEIDLTCFFILLVRIFINTMASRNGCHHEQDYPIVFGHKVFVMRRFGLAILLCKGTYCITVRDRCAFLYIHQFIREKINDGVVGNDNLMNNVPDNLP
ncbi:hypothetical protein PL78_03865 [Yersinia entomophaga]|uniref:Secreted protein n=1 Tax=Yersinia entomophaga TaxID=935293 RepID=A0ABN4PNW7_YERET|nr:hypothetical protein PL78_03865 [Yersinia entomophaga]OWF88799.1 hypothetical protein B4914_06210 [Yersinia entomophaga]